MNVKEAKKKLAATYRQLDGFVGVGITRLEGKDALQVYVLDPHSSIVTELKNIDCEFEGYPITIQVSGEITAHSSSRR